MQVTRRIKLTVSLKVTAKIAAMYKLSCKLSADVSDHVEVLRRVYGGVAEKLEAQSIARNMFQLNALTLKELESIQSKHSEPVKAAQRLLNIVVNQSGNGYAFFMNSLKLTEQKHVYETIVLDGYKGKSCYFDQYTGAARIFPGVCTSSFIEKI